MIQDQSLKTQTSKLLRRFSEYWALNTGYCIGIGAFMAAGWWLTIYTQLLEVTSESLEGVHYLLVRKSASINRGDIVAIQDHKPQYLEGSYLFTKRVVGLPGDNITKTKRGVEVKARNSSISTIFPLLDQTIDRKPLTPLSVSIIPEEYVFVVGDHPRSFDSRYEEFGLVKMENIQGKSLWFW